MESILVRASEFPRKFGHLSQVGRTIFVTHHGRETHALLPIANYREFVATAQVGDRDRARRCVFSNQGLADWLPLVLVVTDEMGTIVMANRTAQAIAQPSDGGLVGQALFEALPALRESTFESYFYHSQRSGEPCLFELPGMFGGESWHRVETFRAGRDLVFLARDITDEIRSHRAADAGKTLLDALRAHGGLGSVWFNMRGRISEADQAMCDLLQLPGARLANVPVADLVPVGRRVALRDAIEHVLSQGGPARLETEVIRNDGSVIAVVAAIKDLRGAYGCEGGLMVVTPQ